MRGLLGAGTALSAAAAAVGVWFWQHENSYAASHPATELADTLRWVGIGLALIGIAGVLFGIALLRGDRDR